MKLLHPCHAAQPCGCPSLAQRLPLLLLRPPSTADLLPWARAGMLWRATPSTWTSEGRSKSRRPLRRWRRTGETWVRLLACLFVHPFLSTATERLRHRPVQRCPAALAAGRLPAPARPKGCCRRCAVASEQTPCVDWHWCGHDLLASGIACRGRRALLQRRLQSTAGRDHALQHRLLLHTAIGNCKQQRRSCPRAHAALPPPGPAPMPRSHGGQGDSGHGSADPWVCR